MICIYRLPIPEELLDVEEPLEEDEKVDEKEERVEEVEENLNPNLDQSQTGQQTPSPTKKSRNFSGGLTFFKNFEKFFMKIKK